MSFTLLNRVAFVTGGARRVGRAIALRLAAEGMDVALTYQHSAAEAAEVVGAIEAMGRRALAIQADFASPEAPGRVHDAFRRCFSSCFALVNNASSFDPTPLASLTVEQFDRQMAVNGRAPLFLMQRFAPMLAAHDAPGRIVNFIDIHVMGQPLKGHIAYNASKAALQEATMTLAMELAPRVTVNALAPGVVAWAEGSSEAERREYMRRVPMGRPGTPEDAAAAALFLIRDAGYCTGQVIRLDGGRLWT